MPLDLSPSEVSAYYAARLPHLKQRGPEWRGSCSIHRGKDPNFSVNAETGMAHCHSACDKGWDILGLEQELTGADFKSALAEVERLVGRVPSSFDQARPAKQEHKIPAEKVRESLIRDGWKLAAEFYFGPDLRKVRFEHSSNVQAEKGRPEKSFRWEHREGDVWYSGAGSEPRPLYINRTFRERDQVGQAIGVEGEGKADELAAFDIAAFSFREMDVAAASALVDVAVVLWPDRDEAGTKKAAKAAELIAKHARSVRIIDPPAELPAAGDVIDAVRTLGWGEDRIRDLIAQARPFTLSQSAPDRSAKSDQNSVRESQATKLIELARRDVEYFHDPAGRAYASVRVAGHLETHSLKSKAFRLFLARRYYAAKATAVSAKSTQEAISVLEAAAVFEGQQHPVSCRVGALPDGSAFYLDLGNDKWEAAEITAAGWRVVPQSPIRFRRAKGMLPIAQPSRDLEAVGHLRDLFNVDPNSNDIELFVACLLAYLKPTGPYPILTLNSEAGSGKTTTSRVVKGLIDPNEAPVRTLPREERDLIIAANNSHIVALDNLSHLGEWQSDAICRLSTGGGFATRELYSDEDESLFSVQRPVILNGIEEIATRGDLLDRSIVIELPAIPPERRVSEAEFWRRFHAWAPGILGWLLDATAGALRNISGVKLSRSPRMADFASWIVAAEPALGWKPGFFMAAYSRNREQANTATLEASPIARHLLALGIWDGTAGELLSRLSAMSSEQERKSKSWPQSPRGLSNALRRLIPNLRTAGLEVTFDRKSGGNRERVISLERVVSSPVSEGTGGGTQEGRNGTQTRFAASLP